MKAFNFILLLFPILNGIAQEEQRKGPSATKPSTTDCPTWNKKDKQRSKAEYFQYLRSPKTMVNPQATNFHDNIGGSKIQSNPVPQLTENSNQKINIKKKQDETNSEKVETSKSNETEKRIPFFSKKNNSGNSSEVDKNIITKSENKSLKENEKSVDPKAVSEEKNEDRNTTNSGKANDIKPEIKDSEKPEKSNFKRKLNRLTRKTTKVHRHSNAKCPSF